MSRSAVAWPALLAGVILVSCVSADAPPSESPRVASSKIDATPVSFELARIEGGTVSAAELRGRPTVVLFAATYDTPSQAAVRIVSAVVRRHKPRLNALMIVLEPGENRPLVEAFSKAMDLPFATALADPAILTGEGLFSGLRHVPSIVLLDREGREVWRRIGLANATVLEDALREYAR